MSSQSNGKSTKEKTVVKSPQGDPEEPAERDREGCCGASRTMAFYGSMPGVTLTDSTFERVLTKPMTPRTMAQNFEQPYDINDMVTLRVFCQWRGTVLGTTELWVETLIKAVLFWAIYSVVTYFRWEGFRNFIGSESSVRAFVAMFSTLIGLLLSFYTALNLNRWWQMRQQVHIMSESCKGLIMFLSSSVTRDHALLERVVRYPQASLFLLFGAGDYIYERGPRPLDAALAKEFLLPEEYDMLNECCPERVFVQSETLWAWLGNGISRLNDQGLTKGPPHYCMLMSTVEKGRGAVADIQSYLETPIPKGYVHLLCLMVKLHNFILTALMAFACVMHSGSGNYVGIFRTAFRAFFMPFLYNAILYLNAQVTDPFGHDFVDFPFWQFKKDLQASADSYLKASHRVPEPLSGKRKYGKIFVQPEEPTSPDIA